MNEQQQQLIDEAAQKLAEALAGSYAVTPDPTSAQLLQTEMTQHFCKAMIDKLSEQTGNSQTVTQREAQEAVSPQQRMERGLEEMKRRLEEFDRRLETAKGALREASSEQTSKQQES
jgi:hypothetical protein